MLIVGSDSHTCSSGALGCLAIGLGAADVTMPLVTGQTWFKVPESIQIRLVGKPKLGIGGKDTILYILQKLKRNTIASDRIVEYSGSGLEYLSSDARFAISNMTAVWLTLVLNYKFTTHSYGRSSVVLQEYSSQTSLHKGLSKSAKLHATGLQVFI